MTDIFLSYTERDRDMARRVAEALGSAGWNVWWDRRIPAGETWRSVLEHALEDMRCMVVLWSANSIESEWVYEEATEGRRQGKLVPVMLESVRPPAGFREIQAADLTGWDGSPDFEGLRMLLSDLEHLLGKPVVTSTDGPASNRRSSTKLVSTEHAPAPPYNLTDLPGKAKLTHGASARWPLRALAGSLLLASVATFIILSPRQQPVPATSTPTAATTMESTSRQTEQGVPREAPSTVPPSPSPPTGSIPPDISVRASAALTSSTTLLSRTRPQPEPSAPIKQSNSTRLSSAFCADSLARIQLGETLSGTHQSKFDKEC